MTNIKLHTTINEAKQLVDTDPYPTLNNPSQYDPRLDRLLKKVDILKPVKQ